MKDFCAFLLTLTSSVSILFGVTGCISATTDAEAGIDLRKVSKGRIPLRDIYDKIEVVPLDNAPDGLPLSELSVTADRFLLKGGDRLILSYRQDGSLADSLNPGKAIVDYSVYQDKTLDVLFFAEMRTYHLPDLSLSGRNALDTLVTPTRLARRSEKVMVLPGYKGDKDYLCEYYFDTKKYYASPGKLDGEKTKQIVKGMRFLRSENRLLLLYPNSGLIWVCGEFTYGFLRPDFKRREGDMLEITYAQVADRNVYYSLLLNGEEHLLVYDQTTGKGRLLKTTREGLSLPLGEIRDGINYFCCPADELPRYLTRDLLDSESASAVDAAVRNGAYVIIKYHFVPS